MAQIASRHAQRGAGRAGWRSGGPVSEPCMHGFHDLLVGRFGSRPPMDAGLRWPAL